MQYAAIVLAAGFSRRFGGDKRLACLNGEPMLLGSLRNVELAMAGFADSEVQVVIRARDSIVAPMLGRSSARIVHAPVWPAGMGVSIATAMEALSRSGDTPEALAICLGDMPLVQPQTLQRLLKACTPETICVPVFSGERGHPVVFGRRFFPDLARLRGGQGAKKILRAQPRAVREIVVEDPAVTIDIDRPEDFYAVVQRDRSDRAQRVPDTAPDGPRASSRV